MLLVGHDKVIDAFRNRVAGILHLDLEGTDRRVALISRSEYVAKIRVGESNMGDVVQKQSRAAVVYEFADRFALFGFDPPL